MKNKKIVALVSAAALVFTGITVVSAPFALADESAFFEDFEGYKEVSGTYTLSDTMNDLYADGWSVAGENGLTPRDENDAGQQFAQIVKDGNNKVLELSGGKALGIMLDPGTEIPQGSYEISFRFKPEDAGGFDFSANSLGGFSDIAKHNILYSDSVMRMGHRLNTINVPMTQVGTAENVWYDVKCTVNNDAGFYSVELYKEGEFVARRSAINYADDEMIGFLRLSGKGSTVLVDDVSVKPCEQETLIYEDNFDSYSEVRLATTYAPIGSPVTEVQSREGESFFEGYTPWRALKAAFNIDSGKSNNSVNGNNYDLVYDETLASQVVRLGDTGDSGMVLMLLDGEFLTKESQTKRGKLRLTYKFRDYTDGKGLGTTLDIISQYNYSGKWDYPPQVAILEKTLGSPAVSGQPYLKTNGSPVKINQAMWYDAELIFDVINDNVSVIIKEDGTGKEIANFNHKTNWMNPAAGKAPIIEKIKAINFRAISGSAIYIDDVKLEYYVVKPTITGSAIVITDYKGEEVTDKKNVPAAISSIELPFGSEMTEDSTNQDSVILSDSQGKSVSYTPEYDASSYTIVPDGLLTPGETYTLTVLSTVANSFGRELGEDFEYSFTVANDYPELMTIGSVSITDLADVTNGSTIKAQIDYANSTDTPLGSLPFAAFYGDNMLLATTSAVIDDIGAGEMGTKTVSFTVPAAAKLDMSKVDKISLCLWKGFKNSAAYCGETDIYNSSETASSAEKTADGKSKPSITYSYNDSVLNISGVGDADSKYLTVQIIKPGNTFAAGAELDAGAADEIVFYRAQIPVTNGKYSLDVRFDSKENAESTLEAGDYPAAIYLDDEKIFSGSVYLSSASDFEDVCEELNSAAAANDFTEFKNIINNKRSALNFNNELLGDDAVGDEIKPYFEYVKKNPIKAANEKENSEMFNTYVVIQYLNNSKIENVTDTIDSLLIDDDIKALCKKVLTTKEKGKCFTGLISKKKIDDPKELEKCINEALILTAAKYGNGYGELKEVLENCGEGIGIEKPVSTAACKDLIGKTYKDAKSFKNAYDESIDSSSGGSGGGSGKGTGGGSGGSYSGGSKSSISSAEIPVSGKNDGGVEPISKTFNDIDNYEWAMIGILALADRGIINGVSEDRFDPSRNITREEFAKILVGALGVSDYEYGGNIFSDASDGDWFVKYINIAAKLGIVKGIGNGEFGVGLNITRQDMAVMLYNALQYRNNEMLTDAFRFDDDGEIADYAKTAVSALHSMGAINGMTETTFVPGGFATRAQAAKIIYSVFNELQG